GPGGGGAGGEPPRRRPRSGSRARRPPRLSPDGDGRRFLREAGIPDDHARGGPRERARLGRVHFGGPGLGTGHGSRALKARRIVDLSHPIEAGMTTYPGLPGPALSDFLSRVASRSKYAAGTSVQSCRIELGGSAGSYVDAPVPRFETGADVAALELERLAGSRGLVFDATASGRGIGPELFGDAALAGMAALV